MKWVLQDRPAPILDWIPATSSIENWNGKRTGYSIRRFTNDNESIIDMSQKQEIPSIQIRFTEVVFNYIEALLELERGSYRQTMAGENSVQSRFASLY